MDFSFVLVIDNCTKNDVSRGICQRRDHFGDAVDLGEGEVLASGYIIDYAGGTLDGTFDEWSRRGGHGGFFGAVFAAGNANAEHGGAGVAHDGLDVSKIDVHETGDGNDVRDALNALSEDVIGKKEGVLERGGLADDVQEAIVGNDDESVDVLAEGVDAIGGLVGTAAAFKGEGVGNDTDGEDSHVLGETSNDRGCASTGSSTHAGGDEDHVCTRER